MSPHTACQCIQVCPYDGLEEVVLNATCNYIPETVTALFPDLQIYAKPGAGLLSAIAEQEMRKQGA